MCPILAPLGTFGDYWYPQRSSSAIGTTARRASNILVGSFLATRKNRIQQLTIVNTALGRAARGGCCIAETTPSIKVWVWILAGFQLFSKRFLSPSQPYRYLFGGSSGWQTMESPLH